MNRGGDGPREENDLDELERDELGKEEIGLSRRDLLKRMAAGSAVAWVAPAVMSIPLPAYAQVISPRTSCGCAFTPCGPDCFATDSTEQVCFCWQNFPCDQERFAPCETSATCPEGWSCEPCGSCHVGYGSPGACAPPCGTQTFIATGVATNADGFR